MKSVSKIIQIAASTDKNGNNRITALCEDGTVWVRHEVGGGNPAKWIKIELP